MVNWRSVIRSRLVWNPPVDGDPRQFSKSRKWTLVALIAVASILPGFCSTIILPAIEGKKCNTEHNTTIKNANRHQISKLPWAQAQLASLWLIRFICYLWVSLLYFTAVYQTITAYGVSSISAQC